MDVNYNKRKIKLYNIIYYDIINKIQLPKNYLIILMVVDATLYILFPNLIYLLPLSIHIQLFHYHIIYIYLLYFNRILPNLNTI